MNLITVREAESLNYLRKTVSSRVPIYLTADPAFLLPTAPDGMINELLKTMQIDTEIPIIGISVSSETAKYHYRYGERKFAELLALAIDYVTYRYRVQVVLIPHSTWRGHGGDDRIISKTIYDLTKRRERIRVIEGNYGPTELKGIISKCDMFIGMRCHACIAALSSCVPTIAIGHNPKYFGTMNLVGQGEYVYGANEITSEGLISVIDRLWSYRNAVKRKLENKIEMIKNLATLNAKLFEDIVIRRT
jgi:colanic acid/amylovoran biosynthesis protein